MSFHWCNKGFSLLHPPRHHQASVNSRVHPALLLILFLSTSQPLTAAEAELSMRHRLPGSRLTPLSGAGRTGPGLGLSVQRQSSGALNPKALALYLSHCIFRANPGFFDIFSTFSNPWRFLQSPELTSLSTFKLNWLLSSCDGECLPVCVRNLKDALFVAWKHVSCAAQAKPPLWWEEWKVAA